MHRQFRIVFLTKSYSDIHPNMATQCRARRGCRPFRYALQKQNKEPVRLILLQVLWRPGGC